MTRVHLRWLDGSKDTHEFEWCWMAHAFAWIAGHTLPAFVAIEEAE